MSWSVGSPVRWSSGVDRVDSWSTRSKYQHVRLKGSKWTDRNRRSNVRTVQIIHERWTSDLTAIVGLRSNEQIKSKPLLFIKLRSNPDRSSPIERLRKDRDDSLIDVQSRSFIAIIIRSDGCASFRFFLKTVLRDGLRGSRSFLNYSL